jgi:hypothetical protein
LRAHLPQNTIGLEHDPIRLNRIMLQIPCYSRNLTANRPGALRPIMFWARKARRALCLIAL